jgi:hypothetical protein
MSCAVWWQMQTYQFFLSEQTAQNKQMFLPFWYRNFAKMNIFRVFAHAV